MQVTRRMSIDSHSLLVHSIDAFRVAAGHGERYLRDLEARNVAPNASALSDLERFREALPEGPSDPAASLDLLARYGGPATMATAAGRFFGLVVGGTLPAALGARVIASAWDQVVFNDGTSAVGVELEKIAAGWLLDLFGLPGEASVGFVTGTTMGALVCLAAARHALLAKAGWDVAAKGLNGAPRLHVVATAQMHVTNAKVLSLLGFGAQDITYVVCDEQGRMKPDALPELTGRSLVIAQAGNVNSGAVDPIGEICARARAAGAWVHVDGAFGLWAAASPKTRHLVSGYEAADSWVSDGHKWLNTPYDCGFAICRWPQAVHAVMATVAPYLKAGESAAPKDMVPEFSRSARGVEVWAALRSLGREGVADLVDRCCHLARLFADQLRAAGFEILNDVVLNQVVATLPGREAHMPEIAARVRASGEAWFGPTRWRGVDAIRLSVSSWVTTEEDVRRTVAAIRAAVA
jgi:glutamate/tyrosine decarboxylase-like PLP-dependent enzyme